ncbi:MAG: type I-E CRISPR-associated protein Cse2/CasB [Verrucomicrobia bacterium]|nr:type I-E CRISPR-associated protein Cse2/CasB [Verrucomicrobiota bacterium]
MKPNIYPLLALTTRRDGQPDRGALANLRRGLSETTRHLAWPYLAQLGIEPDDEPSVLTAALFAEHPMHAKAGNIGATWRNVYNERRNRKQQEPTDPEQLRFRRLIACDAAEIADHLLGIVRFSRNTGSGVPIDYDQLWWDLREWFGEIEPRKGQHPVKLRWACGFHLAAFEPEPTNETAQVVSE